MSSSKKRHGLGKGLEALLKSNDVEIGEAMEAAEREGVKEIDINLIDVNPDQPRAIFNEAAIVGLAQTIAEHGLINPITVREKDGRYQIISGERRFRALKYLKSEFAKALVLNVADSKMLELTLIENIQRADLNPIEIAKSYKRLINDLQITQDSLANRVGKSRSTITNAMRILDLSEPIQNLVMEDKITEGHARTILAIEDLDMRESIANRIIENGYSVRECEQIVREIKAKNNPKTPNKQSNTTKKDPNIRRVESELEKIFATKVLLQDKDGREGRIVIEYYTTDDFERIMEILENIKLSENKINETKRIDY